MKVGIIILSWNSAERIEDCLNSVRKYLDCYIYVVDNNSEDNSVEIISKNFPEVNLIKLPVNHGYCGGCNVGIKKAIEDNCEAIFLLNDDAIVVEDFLTPIKDLMQADNEIGIIGPVIVEAKNEEIIQFGGGKIIKWTASFKAYNKGKKYQKQESLSDTDYVIGAGMMISKILIDKIGYFDEEYYPAYVEEIDFCYRAKKSGFALKIYNGARLKHIGEASRGSYGTGFTRVFKNKFLFSIKHCNPLEFSVACFFICSRILIYKLIGRI